MMETYNIGAFVKKIDITEPGAGSGVLDSLRGSEGDSGANKLMDATESILGSTGKKIAGIVGTIFALLQGQGFGAFTTALGEIVGLLADIWFITFFPALKPFFEKMRTISRILVQLAEKTGGPLAAFEANVVWETWMPHIMAGIIRFATKGFQIGEAILQGFMNILEGDMGQAIKNQISEAWNAAIDSISESWTEFSANFKQFRDLMRRKLTKSKVSSTMQDALGDIWGEFESIMGIEQDVALILNENLTIWDKWRTVGSAVQEMMQRYEDVWYRVGIIIGALIWKAMHDEIFISALIGAGIGGYLANLATPAIAQFILPGFATTVGSAIGFAVGGGVGAALFGEDVPAAQPSEADQDISNAVQTLNTKAQSAANDQKTVRDPRELKGGSEDKTVVRDTTKEGANEQRKRAAKSVHNMTAAWRSMTASANSTGGSTDGG